MSSVLMEKKKKEVSVTPTLGLKEVFDICDWYGIIIVWLFLAAETQGRCNTNFFFLFLHQY
jgi:hypothetical protein